MGHEDSHVDVVPDNTTPEPTTDADDENTATRMSHDEQTPDVPVGAPLEQEGDESAGGVAATELDDDTPAQATDGSLTADDVSETRDADVSVTLDSGSSRAEQGVTTDGPDAPTRPLSLSATATADSISESTAPVTTATSDAMSDGGFGGSALGKSRTCKHTSHSFVNE